MHQKITFLFAFIALAFLSATAQTTFNYTGSVQTYTVPAGVTKIAIDAKAASGGGAYNTDQDVNSANNKPGKGGRVVATISVTPGEILNVYVGGVGGSATNITAGGGGYNGGGNGSKGNYEVYGGGGGATDIRRGGTALGNRIIVAGGGGGSDADANTNVGGNGGDVTGAVGRNNTSITSPTGGTQSAGGAAGVSGSFTGTSGTLGIGGNGATALGSAGAGGGGGYYGGGGSAGGSGGGGSSYIIAGATFIAHYQGNNSGNGSVIISIPVSELAKIPPGNALNFDGTNDVLNVSNATTVFDQTTLTVEGWVKRETLNGTNVCLFSSRNSSGVARFSIHMGDNSIGLYNGFAYNTIAATFTAGVWYHIAVVLDAATKVYVNGSYLGNIITARNTTANNLPFQIGSGVPAGAFESFNGSMDEVRIWNYERTATQIADNYLNVISSPTTTTGLLLYYNFDIGIAGSSNTTRNTIVDSSASALNGLLTNFALTGSTSNWVESYAMVVPTANIANNFTFSGNTGGFTANWTAPVVGTVNNYLLDISANVDFSSPVTGYNGLSVSGTSQVVTGLSLGTTYYYRVRANKTSVAGQGGNSNIITTKSPTVWTGNDGQLFASANSWNPNGVPSGSSNIIFPNTVVKLNDVSVNTTVNTVTIQSGAYINLVHVMAGIKGVLNAINGITINPGGAFVGVGGGYNTNSTVTIQQAISAQRGWRMLVNPFSTTANIATIATDNAITISTSANPASGLTDSRTYSNSTGLWSNVTGNCASYTPYALFIRGLASEVTGSTYTGGPTAFTYSVSGALNSGYVNITQSTSNFNIVGNCYTAPVTSSSLTGHLTNKPYYTYQITTGTTTAAKQTKAGSWVAASSNSSTSTTIPVLGVIAYQAVTNSNNNMDYNDMSVSGTLQTGLFGTNDTKQLELLVEKEGDFQDKLFVRLDNTATNSATDAVDLKKMYNDNVNVYTINKNQNQRLAVDARPTINEEIPMGISALAGDYNFKINNNTLPEGSKVVLTDKFLNTETELKAGTVYPFTISSDTSSKGENRFVLNFMQKAIATTTDATSAGFNAKVLGNITQGTIIVKITGSGKPVTITVVDINGKAFKKVNATNGINIIHLGNTAAGIKLLQISNGKETLTEKIINQ